MNFRVVFFFLSYVQDKMLIVIQMLPRFWKLVNALYLKKNAFFLLPILISGHIQLLKMSVGAFRIPVSEQFSVQSGGGVCALFVSTFAFSGNSRATRTEPAALTFLMTAPSSGREAWTIPWDPGTWGKGGSSSSMTSHRRCSPTEALSSWRNLR